MYIDNTYISSLEELKAIIESHNSQELQNGNIDHIFRTELIESFEAGEWHELINATESSINFISSQDLCKVQKMWNLFYGESEHYEELLKIFKIQPLRVDMSNYYSIVRYDSHVNLDHISIDVDIIVKQIVNDCIKLKFKLYDVDGNCISSSRMATESLLQFQNNAHVSLKTVIPKENHIAKVEVYNDEQIIEAIIFKQLFEVNGVKIVMIFVKGGEYQYFDGRVKSVSDYYIAETQITQDLWMAVMGDNPSRFKFGSTYPVDSVEPHECTEFIRRLNTLLHDQLDGMTFDLPTNDQWEYAAKGGEFQESYRFCGSDIIEDVAWINVNSDNHTHKVGLKKPNGLGVYDMHGNVSEVTKDNESNHDRWKNYIVIRGGSYCDCYGNLWGEFYSNPELPPSSCCGVRLVLNII